MTVIRINESGCKKWDQSCQVVVEFHDLDDALQFGKVVDRLLTEAKKGGDFSLNGEYVGHDLNVTSVTVRN